ncbi:Glycine betaine transporter BetP [Providencia stuartii]|nr:Glycine betaine transporter BetP [Providencia stuartii]
MTSAFFKFLDYFPASTFLCVLAMVLVMVFFITSANSAVFVLGMVSENGNPNPTHTTKTIWGVVIAAIAIVLIITGGLSGLQSALVATAIPLSILMLLMCYSTYKGLNEEVRTEKAEKEVPQKKPSCDQSPYSTCI